MFVLFAEQGLINLVQLPSLVFTRTTLYFYFPYPDTSTPLSRCERSATQRDIVLSQYPAHSVRQYELLSTTYCQGQVAIILGLGPVNSEEWLFSLKKARWYVLWMLSL